MFGRAELDSLRLRKELLVLKSDMDRLRLVAELRRLRSPEYWLVEAGNTVRRHPLLATALGGGVGLLVVQSLRRPVAATGWLASLGTLGSTALSLWRLFTPTKRGR